MQVIMQGEYDRFVVRLSKNEMLFLLQAKCGKTTIEVNRNGSKQMVEFNEIRQDDSIQTDGFIDSVRDFQNNISFLKQGISRFKGGITSIENAISKMETTKEPENHGDLE